MQSLQKVEKQKKKQTLGASFRRLFAVISMTSLGDGLTFNALPWLAATITSNAMFISLVSVCFRLPWLLLSLPFGVIIDRFPRNVLMIISSTIRAITISILAFATIGGWVSLPLLIIVTFLFGAAKVMFDSTIQTVVPIIVEKQQLERANGLFSTAQLITSDILGGALAGMLIMIGLPLPFVIDAVTSTCSIPLLKALRGSDQIVEKRKHLSFRSDIMEGIRLVKNSSLLRALAIFSIGMTGPFSSITAVQIFFMKEVLNLNALGFGVLISVATIGSILGGQFVSKIKNKIGTRNSILLAIAVMGLGYGCTGLSSHWAIVGVLYTISAFFVVVWNIISVSIRQRLVPNELLGRVNGVFRFLSLGISSIGAFLGGALVSGGELLVGREWSVRLPYFFLFFVYTLLFLIAFRFFNVERLKNNIG
ncbi:MFS transporter [Brevibacillus borstelensis]|uniref:MFS transporter n=1 Tax=Brevibacillus borstelensis TaxID=45462 RepID=UPI0030C38F79